MEPEKLENLRKILIYEQEGSEFETIIRDFYLFNQMFIYISQNSSNSKEIETTYNILLNMPFHYITREVYTALFMEHSFEEVIFVMQKLSYHNQMVEYIYHTFNIVTNNQEIDTKKFISRLLLRVSYKYSNFLQTSENRDYYQILGIERNATVEEIKSAYKLRSKEWHPDIAKKAHSNEEFILINEAYKTLKDPIKKRKYDQRFKQYTNIYKPNNNPPTSYIKRNNRVVLYKFIVIFILIICALIIVYNIHQNIII